MNKQGSDRGIGDSQNPLGVKEQSELCVGSSIDAESACLCPEKDYLIKDEEDALAELRRIKALATLAKKRLENLKEQIDVALAKKREGSFDTKERATRSQQEKLHDELKECKERIESLRSEWKDWDERRKEATRKKLILLGHIS